MTPRKRNSGGLVVCTLALLGACSGSSGGTTGGVGVATNTFPAPGALEVDPAAELRITLEPAQSDVVIDASSVVLRDLRFSVPVAVAFDADLRIATIRPARLLTPGAVHEITVRDAAGSGWSTSWKFATRDDRAWQPMGILPTATLLPSDDGTIHAYWDTQPLPLQPGQIPAPGIITPHVMHGTLGPGSATMLDAQFLTLGALATAGRTADGTETVLVRTDTTIDAYDRAPGGAWVGPNTAPDGPTTNVFEVCCEAYRAPDGTVALFHRFSNYHFWGYNCVPYDAAQGWAGNFSWSWDQYSPAPSVPLWVDRDWISHDQQVEVVATIAGTEWRVTSEFAANDPLWVAPGAERIVVATGTNAGGQATFAWISSLGNSWAMHATKPSRAGENAEPVVLGLGNDLPSDAGAPFATTIFPQSGVFDIFLGPGGHAVVAMQLEGRIRTWRFDPTTDAWSEAVDLPGQGFRVAIDAWGDVLLATFATDGSASFYRGYAGLGWGTAKETPAEALFAVPFQIIRDPIGGDVLGTYRRI